MLRMLGLTLRFDRGLLCCGAAAVVTTCGLPQALGQGTATPAHVTGFDVYGNAQPVLPPRTRPAGIYPPSPSILRRQVVQPTRRAQRRPGSYVPFSLPGDLLQLPQYRRARTPSVTPLPIPAFSTQSQQLSARTRQAFEQYGGFDRRAPAADVGDALRAFSRRYGLIRATSFTGPVLRARSQRHGPGGVQESLSRTPFVAPPEAAPTGATLEEKLVRDIRVSRDRARREAWALFADRQYRQAALEFETAYLLDPEDYEARLGEIFCFVSLEAPHTALALLHQLKRRDPNPFRHSIDLLDRYASREEANRVRIGVRLAAERGGAGGDIAALNALALWYLGDRREALAAASSAAGSQRDRYRDWPEKVRAALSAPAPPEGD